MDVLELIKTHGTLSAAARASGIPRTTLNNRLRQLELNKYVPARPNLAEVLGLRPKVKDVIPPLRSYVRGMAHTKDVGRVVVIGDLHRKPGFDSNLMTWIGRYVAEARPDHVVQIGDFLDLESCEMHSAPGSAANAGRPAFLDDIEAGEDSLYAYHKEVPVGSIPHHITLGNHEYRANRVEEASPILKGTLLLKMEEFFARYRWEITPYRQWLFLYSVGFTHVPMSIMNKPIGGRYPENTIGNQATHSIVFGHTHRYAHVTVPKIGICNSITVTNVGSAMPTDYTASYCEGATTGHTKGIVDMRIHDGNVISTSLISTIELENRFK